VDVEPEPEPDGELEVGVERWVPPAALVEAPVPFVAAEPLRPFLPDVPCRWFRTTDEYGVADL
jgi:hypothetical protein